MTPEKDELFRQKRGQISDFEFGAETAGVFDDMLVRSVPLYAETQRMIAELAADFAQPGTKVYDLGCSTATTFLGIDPYLPPDIEFVGVDSSQDMLKKADEKLAQARVTRPYELRRCDLEDVVVEDASVVIMNLTLQFVRPLHRKRVIDRIASGLCDGGAFILVEKVLSPNSRLNRLFINHYYDFKRRNGYSDLEIAQKREALENVLIPYHAEENRQLLLSCGFSSCDEFMRWFNFCGVIALEVTLRDLGSGSRFLQRAGDFLFHYRGLVIPGLLAMLLVFGRPAEAYRDDAVARALTAAGIAIALLGQTLRFFVIGFAYIKRGGKNRRIYADDLVTEGVYAHVRNPMYVGNFLILVGLAFVFGAPLGFFVGVPAIGFVYFAIVVSEEAYLRAKFGAAYDAYARDVNRFVPRLRGLGATLEGSRYDWRKALRKEYGTPHGLGWGIVLLILFRTLRLEGVAGNERLFVLAAAVLIPWTLLYIAVRRWKMSGGLASRTADA